MPEAKYVTKMTAAPTANSRRIVGPHSPQRVQTSSTCASDAGMDASGSSTDSRGFAGLRRVTGRIGPDAGGLTSTPGSSRSYSPPGDGLNGGAFGSGGNGACSPPENSS